MIKSKEYRRIIDKILSLLDEGVHVVDSYGKTIIYNDAMAKMEKMNPDQVIRKPFQEVFSHIEESQSTMLQALKHDKTTTNIQQSYHNIDGKEITTINSTYPLIFEGKKLGAVEIAKNITDIQKLSKTILNYQREIPEPENLKEGKIKAYNFHMIIGENKNFVELIRKAKKAAASDASVLIAGDTGTGKELFAQSIHYHSPRKKRPLLAQNCAALPENLLEGILFGTAKGGFTGAMDREGMFEQANGGSLILDEINAMPYQLQGKLLRVLQEDYIRRVGGTKDIPINVRIIATINEPAERLIERGILRKDLYYRLGVINIHLPRLKNRRDDIILLSKEFLYKYSRKFGKEIWDLSEAAKKMLLEYDYPGNVRELENIIMSAVSMADDEHVLTDDHISLKVMPLNDFEDYTRVLEIGLPEYTRKIEKRLIDKAMALNEDNISRAAKGLGISRQNLQHKLKKIKNSK